MKVKKKKRKRLSSWPLTKVKKRHAID